MKFIKHDLDKTKNNYVFLSDTIKDYKEIAKARITYGDIINALFGIFDIHTIEIRGWREFEFMRLPRLRYRCSLVYDDDTTSPVSVEMEEFTRDKVLKFVDKLIEMCL